MSRHINKKPLVYMPGMTEGQISYRRRKARVKAASEKRKAEVKEEFEKFLKEEMDKYPLGYNPYQE